MLNRPTTTAAKAIVIDWTISKRITVDLTMRAFQVAVNLRQPKASLMFHSSIGSQYSSKRFQALLKGNKIISSMSGSGLA